MHGSFNQQGAGATERVIQLGVWIDMSNVDDAGCKGLLDGRDDRAFAVAAFVQSGAGGIHCNHHLVVVDGKIDRTGAAAFLKPADAVRLLETGDNRLFDNRLAVGDAVQLRFERPAALDRKGHLSADVVLPADAFDPLEQFFKTPGLKRPNTSCTRSAVRRPMLARAIICSSPSKVTLPSVT